MKMFQFFFTTQQNSQLNGPVVGIIEQVPNYKVTERLLGSNMPDNYQVGKWEIPENPPVE